MNLDIGKGMLSILFVLIIIFVGLLRNPVETFVGGYGTDSNTIPRINSSIIAKLFTPLGMGIFTGVPAMKDVVSNAIRKSYGSMDGYTKEMVNKLFTPLGMDIFAGMPNMMKDVSDAMKNSYDSMDPETKETVNFIKKNPSIIFDKLMENIYKVPDLESRISSLENNSQGGSNLKARIKTFLARIEKKKYKYNEHTQ